MNAVSSDYWKTMGVPLVEGRDFNAATPAPRLRWRL